MVALLLFINLIIQCFHFSISSPSQKNFHFSIVASKSDNTASKSNTHNRDNIFNSIGKLQNQLLQENMPIFSFQKDITIILKQVIEHSYFDDLIPIESLMHEYLGLLRDYYYDIFTKRLSETILDTESDSSSSSLSSLKVSSVYQQSIWIAYVETSQLCLLEFEVAKNSSLPNLPICSSWYTQVSNANKYMCMCVHVQKPCCSTFTFTFKSNVYCTL